MLLTTILFGLIFLLITILTLYLPGFIIISKAKGDLEDQELVTFSFTLGIVLFVVATMFFGLINFRNLILPLFLILDLFVLVKYKLKSLKPLSILIKEKVLGVFVILCILVQGFINFPSGYLYKDGLYFWSSQGHDGLWHVALMEEIKKNFPPNNPVFSGEKLYNYHYFIDVLMGEYGRIFPFLTTLDLYFRFFPVILSFLITISVYSLSFRWFKNKKISFLVIFFTTLAGSFGWVVNIMRGRGPFGGETVFWASQTNTIIGNPPHAISFSLLTAFFLSLWFYLEKKSKYWFLICFILGFILSGFKVSAGIVLLVGLGIGAAIELIFTRKKELVFLASLLFVANTTTIELITKGASSFLIFSPWWFIRTLIVSGDRLNWINLENKREFYLSLHTIRGYLRVLEYELIAFFLFLFGNIGMRFVGFFEMVKKIAKGKFLFFKSPFEVVMLGILLTGFLIPLLFVQKGVAYNDIQFFQYFNLYLGFYAGAFTYNLISNFKRLYIRVVTMIVIIALSVPTVIGNLVEFYGPKTAPNAKITNAEIEALNFLKNNTAKNSIILTLPFRDNAPSKFKPNPIAIYSWFGTAYVSALASRPTYFSDEEQAAIMAYPLEERLRNEKEFFAGNDSNFNKKFLNSVGIKYIYVPKIAYLERLDEKGSELSPKEANMQLEQIYRNLKKVFENEEINIYEVE